MRRAPPQEVPIPRLPGSASTTGASSSFESTVLTILKAVQEEQSKITCKTDKNLAGIIEVNAKVDEGRKETAALGKRVDTQGKHLECVAAKMLKMEAMLRSGSAPVFQMTPRADPRGPDPMTTNDAWARSRAAAPTSAQTPQTSAAAAA